MTISPLPNPFRRVGYLYLARGSVLVIIGIALLLIFANRITSSQKLLNPTLLITSFILLVVGFRSLKFALHSISRVLVDPLGPEELAPLATDKRQNSQGHTGKPEKAHDQSYPYSVNQLKEMLRCKALYARHPRTLLHRLMHSLSFLDDLVFAPLPLRNCIERTLAAGAYTLLISILWGLAVFPGELDIIPMHGTAILEWITWLYVAGLLVIWYPQKPKEKAKKATTLQEENASWIAKIVISAIFLPLGLIFINSYIPLPPPPISPFRKLLFILIGAAIVIGFCIAMWKRTKATYATDENDVSISGGEIWHENVEKSMLMREFKRALSHVSSDAGAPKIFVERVDSPAQLDARLGEFNTCLLMETSPRLPNGTYDIRLIEGIGLIVGNLMFLAGLLLFLIGIPNLEFTANAPVAWGSALYEFFAKAVDYPLFLESILIMFFGDYLIDISLLYISELSFNSFLVNVICEGNFRRVELSAEMSIASKQDIKDHLSNRDRAHSMMVHSKFELSIRLARIKSSTFATVGMRDLHSTPRFVTKLQADTALLENVKRRFKNQLAQSETTLNAPVARSIGRYESESAADREELDENTFKHLH